MSLVAAGWGEPITLALIAGLSLVNWTAARVIGQGEAVRASLAFRAALAIDLLAFAGVYAFAARSGSPLPLGAAFVLPAAISYLVDIRQGRAEPGRWPDRAALNLALFPKLAAGPVVRWRRLAPGLERLRVTPGRLSAGLRLVVIGLAQKLLLADQIAPLAAGLFDQTVRPRFAEAWLGLCAFSLQISFDLSGYSLMAAGLGAALGLRLPRNLRRPLRALSVTDFWRRWLLGATAWMQAYVVAPLSRTRLPEPIIVALVFLLIALWQGPSWLLLAWGGWQGAWILIERQVAARGPPRVFAPAAWSYAMLVTGLGWVLFRAPSFHRAGEVYAGLLGLHGFGPMQSAVADAVTPFSLAALSLAAVLALVPRLRWPAAWAPLPHVPRDWRVWVDAALIASLFALCVLAVAQAPPASAVRWLGI